MSDSLAGDNDSMSPQFAEISEAHTSEVHPQTRTELPYRQVYGHDRLRRAHGLMRPH